MSPPFDLLVPLFSVLAPTESVKLFKLINTKSFATVEPTKVTPPSTPVAVAVTAARPGIADAYHEPVCEVDQSVFSESDQPPLSVNSKPVYSEARLRTNGASLIVALPRTASLDVLQLRSMSVVHSVVLLKP